MIVNYVMPYKMMSLKILIPIKIVVLNFKKMVNMDIFVNNLNIDVKLNRDN